MSEQQKIRLGIIGGGLMGKEVASAIGRWFTLQDFPTRLELTAVADINEQTLCWFDRIPSVTVLSTRYADVLESKDVDVVYVAVPHDQHERIYIEALTAGKDLLAEKPFGIDLKAAMNIAMAARVSGRFVRCSSEFPFFPGAQRVVQMAGSGELGRLLEIRAGFWHSSDLDPQKPINWKRQTRYCGLPGVMNDLGMHVLHIPLRLGWRPKRVHAQLQNIVAKRPDGHGNMADCDTWDNAILNTDIQGGDEEIPMRLEMKRIAPGEANTWFIEVLGTDGAARFSTKEPKTLWTFKRAMEQQWIRTDLGYTVPFPAVTGAIFEVGFPDVFMQMLAAFVAEREGFLGDRFGCVTPDEALESHRIWEAALQSAASRQVVEV